MKVFTTLIAIIIAISSLVAESQEKYSQIKIFVPDRTALNKIWSAGIDYEGSSGKVGGWMEFVANQHDLQQLISQGISYTIIHDDLSVINQQSLSKFPVDALGFGYGSMGGYYTYEEVKSQLDSMKLLYPNIITAKESIGTSVQGRAIWIAKISDNPNNYETDEPEALYTALTHAREPQGMMTVIYYMWWLLENYGSNSDATYLVNNRQMWFMPVINPDGYVYNQTTNPSGGGMWRKNRRNNGGGIYGVDLNRNFGPYYMWDSPNGGSSTNPAWETYRGVAPFSEPEVATIYQFLYYNNVKTCFNYHTYGNLLIYPWGYLSAESSDSLIYREFAFDMVGINRYATGTDLQTVNYSTRGNSDDFMYGGNIYKTFAMTPEVGPSFWPPSNQIFPLAIENLNANIYYSYVAGQYTTIKHNEIIDEDSDGYLEPGEQFILNTTVRNKGLGDASNLEIAISSSSPHIVFSPDKVTLENLLARTDSIVSFSGTVGANSLIGSRVNLYFEITAQGGYKYSDTSAIFIGKSIVLLADSASTGIGNWIASGGWSTTTNAHTPPYSFTDSPTGNHASNVNALLTLASTLNLTEYNYCILRYWTKWAIEPSYDFARVEVSTNGGTNWTSLKSKLSHVGSTRGVQSAGTWGYDGYTPGLNWIEEEIDLTPYVGNQLLLRFRLSSDGADNRDGWYLDDIRVLAYLNIAQQSEFIISDNGGESNILIFGEASAATDGIDEFLGESELPPKPSSGTFDARWSINSTDGVNTDMKQTLSSTHKSNTFTAEFQPGSGGYPITLRWNPARFLDGGWKLRDGLTHGTLININMWTDTSLVITNTSIQSIEITHSIVDTLQQIVDSGWNIISVPVITENRARNFLYPQAKSEAFAYQGSYVIVDALEYLQSYWLKFISDDTITFTGTPIVRGTLQIPAGWALIAGLSYATPVNQMQCNPPPCKLFVYRGTYLEPTTLTPGEGFWMKGPRQLSYSTYPAVGSVTRKDLTIHEMNSFSTVTISNAVGRKATLYFDKYQELEASALEGNELPPLPLHDAFDVRFESQRNVHIFNSSDASNEIKIQIQSSIYPVTVEWNRLKSDNTSYELAIVNDKAEAGVQSLTMKGSMLITDPNIKSLILRNLPSESVPRDFALYQNYPNPFNPATTISFDLPTPSIVTLKIFNTLGQEVSSILTNRYYDEGRYSTNIDGSKLPSGLFFYRLTVKSIEDEQTVQLQRKMIIIR
ncbi:MAG: M14 family zinc carboxypeptidase [Bacteroidota bacterium]|nr:M14 family zinc carboxypeptidase [Bacteroidota bacterium]